MRDAAIEVIGVNKSYQDGKPILENFSMVVEKQTIFGLFGSSGCGKTTLLNCIMGLKRLDSGYIKIIGKDARDLKSLTFGNMPQETALYEPLTIFEMFEYFGKLYGMSGLEINAASNQLMTLLNLPKASSLVSKLSGGQRRRVSLGIALLNSPPILCLDECSVGTDAVVRERIWMHLRNLVANNKTTVILTTHCTGELQLCDKVGIMRKGKLIAEDSPQSLLQKSGALLLKDAIKYLCEKDEEERQSSNNLLSIKFNNSKTIPEIVIGTCFRRKLSNASIQGKTTNTNTIGQQTFSKNCATILGHILVTESRRLSALTKRNLIYRFRQPLTAIFDLILPIITTIAFLSILGKDPTNIKLSVFNPEATFPSNDQQFTNQTLLSSQFLDNLQLNEGINLDNALSLEAAKFSVTSGKATGYINFPNNFTVNLYNRLALKNYAQMEVIDGSTIQFHLDLTNAITSQFLMEKIANGYGALILDIATQFQIDKREVEYPLKFNAIYGTVDEEHGWEKYFAPPTGLLIVFCFALGSTCLFHADDKQRGTVTRSLATGLKMRHLFLSYFCSELVAMVYQTISIYSITLCYYGFDMVKGSLWLLFFLSVLASMVGVSLGLLIAETMKGPMESLILSVFLALQMFTTSGQLWPVEAIPYWYRMIFFFTNPLIQLGLGFRGIWNKGWGIGHPIVNLGIAVPIVYIVVCFLLLLALQNRRKSRLL